MASKRRKPKAPKGSESPPPPLTEAACARARQERERRVDHVLKLMTKGNWHTRQYQQLQAKWGVGLDAVKDYAREASGILRHCVQGDPDAVRAALIAGIESLRMRCRSRKRTWMTEAGPVSTADPDYRTELAAYELHLKALGLIVERVQEVAPDGLPNSIEELRELARRELAKVAAEAKEGE